MDEVVDTRLSPCVLLTTKDVETAVIVFWTRKKQSREWVMGRSREEHRLRMVPSPPLLEMNVSDFCAKPDPKGCGGRKEEELERKGE